MPNTRYLPSILLHQAIRLIRIGEGLRVPLRRQAGQGMVEYGLILVLVAIALIASLIALQSPIKTVFNNVVSGLRGTSP